MPERAVRIVVHGHVQGVFFRQSTLREAERLGVAGWVRNRADGTVEAFAEGPSEAIDALVRWAHDGPRGARVDQVDVSDAQPEGVAGFCVR